MSIDDVIRKICYECEVKHPELPQLKQKIIDHAWVNKLDMTQVAWDAYHLLKGGTGIQDLLKSEWKHEPQSNS